LHIKRIVILGTMAAALLSSQVTSSSTQIYGEVPAGIIDGVNVTFTLAYVPVNSNSVTLFRNGMRQQLGVDYTLAGKTVTFTTVSTPQSSDSLLVDYAAPGSGTNSSLLAVNNLADLSNVAAARTNLGLGSAATQPSTNFDAAGAANGVALGLLSGSNTFTGATTNFTQKVAIGSTSTPGAPLDVTGNAYFHGGTLFVDMIRGYTTDTVSLGPTTTLKAAGLATAIRTVSAADTASYQDHTLLLDKSLTENLPAYPVIGQEFYLANIGSLSVTISGNGKNIWSAGTNSASITLASNATAILQFDGTLWCQIK
jgi:hypothetical protein